MASCKQQNAPVIEKPAAEKLYMQLNESELTAIIMKGSPNSNDRDAGFCSGSSEGGDDLSIDHTRLEQSSSPIDASNDSVEVKVTPISLVRNKRKSSEPSKVIAEMETATATTTRSSTTTTLPAVNPKTATAMASSLNGPLKKRIRYTSSADSAVVLTQNSIQLTPTPTPPPAAQHWDASQLLPHELMPNPAQIFVRHPGVTTLHRMPFNEMEEQQEPLALVSKKRKSEDTHENNLTTTTTKTTKKQHSSNSVSGSCSNSQTTATTPSNSVPKSKKLTPKKLQNGKSTKASLHQASSSSYLTPTPAAAFSTEFEAHDLSSSAEPNTSSSSTLPSTIGGGRTQQRNYKNMTRERRIEANARERTRVHTISAAYETLRKAVPSYSNAQKLSKLSVLRVACSYILTLSRMAGEDYSVDESEPSIASCFEAVTSTIMTEGKLRKKKEEEEERN